MKNVLDGKITECIPEVENINSWLEIAGKYHLAFEYNDFFKPECLNNPEEYKRRLDIYRNLGRDTSGDTLHGVFLDMVVNSQDNEIRNICRDRVRKSMETAVELGCRAVVFHTNYLVGFKSGSYRNEWVKECSEFYHILADEFNNTDILIENMFDDSPEMLGRLMKACDDVPNIGVCFDVAHAAVWNNPLNGWIETLGKYIRHIHMNDNDLHEDLHLPLGEGSIDYSILNQCRMDSLESVLLEVSGTDAFLKSYSVLQEMLKH